MAGEKITRRDLLRGSAASGMLFLNADAGPRPSSPPGGEETLFAFDDHSIPWRHNLKLTLVPAKKYPGNPVLRCGPEGSPDYGHAILYGTVLHDGGRFRMWYLGNPSRQLEQGQAPGWWRPMCYAESDDGIHWTKPELGLCKFNGNRQNNICLIQGNPTSLTRVNDFLSILHEPDDPDPAKRYKAAYIAHVPFEEIKGGMSNIGVKESRVCSFICATSADGLSWEVVGDRPMNAGGERFEVSSLYRFGDFYYATGQLISPWTWGPEGWNYWRVMMVYRSPDFVHWSQAKALSFARPGQLLRTPVPGQQTHMGAGLWNRGNVLIGLYGMWQDGPTSSPGMWGVHIDLGLIVSNDGIHFREPEADFKVIAHGEDDEWDPLALLQGHAFVNVGDQTMIWYSHGDTEEKFRHQEIGLATLRRDGFGYLSRMFQAVEGHFVTRTFVASGQPLRLLLNAENVTEDAPLAVELRNDLDRPFPGFSGADAGRVAVSGTRQLVKWPNGRDPQLPAGSKFALKVTIPANSAAHVYSVCIFA